MRNRALGHPIGPGGKGGHRFRGNLAFALGDRDAERAPFRVDKVGVGFKLLPAAGPQEAGLDHRAYPVGGRIEAELHEGLCIPAAQVQ
ncbi:hypothetical protein D9M69_571800 [compost metagenome]